MHAQQGRALNTRPAVCCSYQAAGHEVNCFGAHEHMVAAGGQGEVVFWDRRTLREMGKLEDTHMEDVTQVQEEHQAMMVACP